MKNKPISYSAPVCATLTGDSDARYGKPSLMIALRKRVSVSISDKPSDDSDMREIVHIAREVTGAQSVHVDGTWPGSLSQRSVQAGALCAVVGCLLAHNDPNKNPRKAYIQELSYKAEKRLFGQYSHAQTVASVQGGILFFRKEFEFYRTVLKIPAKLPKTHEKIFSQILCSQTELLSKKPTHAHSSEKTTKRLVFAIMSEDVRMFKKALQDAVLYDSTDIPQLSGCLPDYEGLKRIN